MEGGITVAVPSLPPKQLTSVFDDVAVNAVPAFTVAVTGLEIQFPDFV